MIIGKVLAKRAATTPDREAVISRGKVITFSQLNQRANRLANAFLSLGAKPGHRVGLLMHNSNEFLETYFALSKIGAVLVPLNTRLSPEELDFILDDCDVDYFVYGQAFEPVVQTMAFPAKGRPMITTGLSALPGTRAFEDFLAKGDPKEPVVPVDENDLNVIMYTSGTTGHPKGAMLTHKGMYSAGVDMLIGLHYQYPDRCLILGPFFHSGSITPFIGHVVKGIASVIMEKFDPQEALGLMEKHRIQLMLGVTAIMKMMLNVPGLTSYSLDAWKYAILPGSPLPFELIKEAHDRIGVLCQNLWGMTEMCGPGSFMNVEDILRKPESAGKPYFNVDLRIMGTDGSELPSGQVGELVVRAPHVMLGYWNRPQATRDTIKDGWLYTGDLGYVDPEGFLYIVDRKKDMLVSGGENVYPAEIERVINELPSVAEASVIGIPDEKWGEVPKAFVVALPGNTLTAEDVAAHCRSKLAGYKVPKQIEFLDQLPRTPSGKVLKRKLRKAD
jgi:acyl-CoA synthetase (AMP-forming)/AMP-acid ligase II